MRLFSYVVARDFGFAPNPFYGICTLATCKPNIRGTASVGDWIVGTGSAERTRTGFLVIAMRVTETLTFNEYWEDERFRQKRPNLRGSKKQAFGDNIYFKDDSGTWHQEDSHHSNPDGSTNANNVLADTKADRVLLSTEFKYWGGLGPEIPPQFRNYRGFDICARRNHKCCFPESLIEEFIDWISSLPGRGYLGAPLDWNRTP